MYINIKDKIQLTLKIVLLGQQNVGKTSLIRNFIEGRFLEHETGTAGAQFQFKMMNLGGEQTKVQIWDTGGQEKYSVMTKLYYRDTNGCMIVYDVMNSSSLDRAVFDFQQVLKVNTKARFAIIGNKTDLSNEFTITSKDAKTAFYNCIQDNIDREQIFNGLLFFETSAKLGTNVEVAFHHLAQHCIEIDVQQNDGGLLGCCKK